MVEWTGSVGVVLTGLQVGVRCSLRLEAPVADAGQLLVSEDHIRWAAYGS